MATYSSGESSGSGSMLSQSSDCSTNITESLSFETQRTPAIIKPDVLKDERQRIIELIKQAGFSITRFEKILLSRNQAESLYCQHEGKDFYDILINWITRYIIPTIIGIHDLLTLNI
jgi:hypothetical protein